MIAALTLPRVHGPGLGWLPEVLRQRATWLTVWRFLWAGPLIGTLPYAWMLISLPVGYAIGAVPAAAAGLLFAVWYHGQHGRVPTWPWRATMGALAGGGATAVVAAGMLMFGSEISGFYLGVVALHGVPAALVLGLLHNRGPSRPASAATLPPPASPHAPIAPSTPAPAPAASSA